MKPNVEQLNIMLNLQTGFNNKVMTDWKTNPPNYCDAIWTEAAEAFDHTAWPWWKKAGADIDVGQIKMELIDIWHFLMSELMCYVERDDLTWAGLIEGVNEEVMKMTPENAQYDVTHIRQAFRNIVSAALLPPSDRRIVILLSVFIQAMNVLRMDWAELYKLYVGKNTLNAFRQNNGYKTDTSGYKARWAKEKGWEDNQYLTDMLVTMDPGGPVEAFQMRITNSLQHQLNKLTDWKTAA